MLTVSLCMIVKDEEDVLERCLSSVSNLVDEIIIVDTGSTDRTKDIARQFTDYVLDFPWIHDFAAARNFSFSHATQNYILWLDADDILTMSNQRLFAQLKEEWDPTADIHSIVMDYVITCDEKGDPLYKVQRHRLVKRECGFQWQGFIHEDLAVSGPTLHSEIAVYHQKRKPFTDRNLLIYRRHIEQGKPLSAREVFYYANELYDHYFIEQAIRVYQQFLTLPKGWLEDKIAACIRLGDCYGLLLETDAQIQHLLQSFLYDTPRAEVCCRLGRAFLYSNQPKRAIYWYTLATTLQNPPIHTGLLHDQKAWTWLPHLQLCVCYDRIGDIEKARYHNEQALQYQPNHPAMLHNQSYLRSRQPTSPNKKMI